MNSLLHLGLLAAAGILMGAAPPGFEARGLKLLSTEASVAALPDGRFRLKDGRTGRLAGLAVPPKPAGQRDSLGTGVERAFQEALSGARIALWVQKRPRDRYGDIVAHLRTDKGLWIQAHLLGLGLARVRTRLDDRALAAAMLEVEQQARSARRGLWAHPAYRVRPDTEVEPDRFQIVEGTVHDVADRRRYVYVNFSRDWRRDFTLRLDRRARRLFKRAGLVPEALKGRRLRVRGWVLENNGPMIDVTHPEQIERLDPPPPARRP